MKNGEDANISLTGEKRVGEKNEENFYWGWRDMYSVSLCPATSLKPSTISAVSKCF